MLTLFVERIMKTARLPDFYLENHFLFSRLPRGSLERLLKRWPLRQINAGDHLFEQAQDAGSFFLVLSGAIKLYRCAAGGQQKVLELIGPGQSLAEAILFMKHPQYLSHARAVRRTHVLVIDREQYLRLLLASPAVALAVAGQVVTRLEQFITEVEALTLKSGRYRLVHYLMQLLPPNAQGPVTLKLPMAKKDVAMHLGMQPESLSRWLREMSDLGLIRMQARNIEIISPTRLQVTLAQLEEDRRPTGYRVEKRRAQALAVTAGV